MGHQVRERVKNRDAQAIILDFTRVPFVDVSSARAVETIGCDARQSGKRVFISGMSEEVRQILSGLDADHCLGTDKDTHFAKRIDAIEAAVEYVLEHKNTNGQPKLPENAVVS